MNLTTKIKEQGKKIGLDEVKITAAEPFPAVKDFLFKMKEEDKLSKFVKGDLDLITDPKQVLSTARSIIVTAISYQVDINQKPNLKEELRGKLSRFTWGEDYHNVLGKKLDQLIDFLNQQVPAVKTKKFVDTGPTVDRALARRAGIGWQGKNCSIIHPEYGSWIFIGGIITDLELKLDLPLENKCGDCQKCIEACPTGALEEPYLLNSSKCLGYVTLSRGYLKEEERQTMGTRLWGCDTCQEVCPYNQEAESGNHSEFQPQTIEVYPQLPDLLTLTDREYQEKFGPTAMNWRGKRPIQRNAAVIMGNLKNPKAIPYLIEGLKDSKPIVRAHSAWALGEIGVANVVADLEQALQIEQTKQVTEELRSAIQKLSS
ncbi:tRNA epoxyqueuosine(34) reductase QueG [Acetohalobium arabaticum]|uniref:Iron-sulfur cluster binding protein n=1 Tax=Acetohalobium arabaticum (strain ATCC 49924 / DSM 5501 / Z-7288) TaxID=574087 RepID=D9QSE4_ACEAZ|nr:tRNA epoxyqueuosine(34) reductase QueG [Acetohalobium arabaticum]ADL13407.1 iron-sulfur cluster binding protein [Acetohalobium arabaticum DSM 5501]